MKPRILVVPVAGLALVTSLVLSGCSFSPFPPAPLPGGGTGGGSSSSGGDGSGDPVVESGDTIVEVPAEEGSSASIPATFPSDIPLIEGPVAFGMDLGTGWTVMITTSDLGRGYDDARARLISAEYTTELDSTTADGSFGVFENASYLINLTANDNGQYGSVVTYIVVLKE